MSVECFSTTKGFHLGIKDIFQAWHWNGRRWRKMRREDYDAEWFCEDYECGVASTSDILSNLCEYLPGVKEWDDYGDFSITFDMDEVRCAGWPEDYLIEILEKMAHKVNRCKTINATDAPYLYTSTDAWGADHTYYRHPAMEPLDGMLHKDFPADLDTTGDRRP